jgi:N6-adenosine-specific RNA methylase IME4
MSNNIKANTRLTSGPREVLIINRTVRSIVYILLTITIMAAKKKKSEETVNTKPATKAVVVRNIEHERPKRKASQKSTLTSIGQRKRTTNVKPSSSMYVGYVEEDETPEMIMRKFAELERIQQMHKEKQQQQQHVIMNEGDEIVAYDEQQQQQNVASAHQDESFEMTEEMMKEVFKATSGFTMRKAMKAEDAEAFGFDEFDRDFYNEYDDDEMEIYDDEDADFWEMLGRRRKRKGGAEKPERVPKAPKEPREPREPREPKAPREPKPQKSHMITAYNSDTGFMIRKKKNFDPRELNVFKLPKHDLPNDPLPITWGRMVKPYIPKEVRDKMDKEVPDFKQFKMKIDKSMDVSKLSEDYLGILMNPPWKIEQAPDKGNVTVEDIAQLPLERLSPLGFIFIWVEKENLSLVCDVMQEKNFNYVENLTWVQMQPNNCVVKTESRYLARSHRTLLIFRRSTAMFPESKAIELRHQRNSDVTLDVVETTESGRRKVPEHVYNSIETLLPTAYNKKAPGTPGKFLELWAEENNKRAGWTTVVNTP